MKKNSKLISIEFTQEEYNILKTIAFDRSIEEVVKSCVNEKLIQPMTDVKEVFEERHHYINSNMYEVYDFKIEMGIHNISQKDLSAYFNISEANVSRFFKKPSTRHKLYGKLFGKKSNNILFDLITYTYEKKLKLPKEIINKYSYHDILLSIIYLSIKDKATMDILNKYYDEYIKSHDSFEIEYVFEHHVMDKINNIKQDFNILIREFDEALKLKDVKKIDNIIKKFKTYLK